MHIVRVCAICGDEAITETHYGHVPVCLPHAIVIDIMVMELLKHSDVIGVGVVDLSTFEPSTSTQVTTQDGTDLGAFL